MSASLVGSEMCIRDRSRRGPVAQATCAGVSVANSGREDPEGSPAAASACLLYTSDAADDM
eukprot:5455085-Alexandrium_andersonii.AAC.1